jgi:lipopolysaccharide/colanic/teichoic acid biosynthesis glycosyltransferase
LGNSPAVTGGNVIAWPIDTPWQSFLELSDHLSTARIAYCSAFKRWLDMLLACLILIPASFFLLIAALAIVMDSRGPVFFRQTRIGRGGKPFTVIKLRTMTVQPPDRVQWFEQADGVRLHKVRNDPRVTRVGRQLRRLSIDELPQLFNVVRGDMSLIGPRPELPGIVEHYHPWQHRRHLVRPGLTGWWQIHGRSDRPMHENTELDLYYVDNVSFSLDIQILCRTVKTVCRGSGAF